MTSLTARVVKNSFAIYGAKAINLFVSFFIFIHIANYLGETSFGRLSIAITFVATFDILANFGINQIVVRELASDRFAAEKILGAGVLLKTATSFLALLLSLGLITLMHYPEETVVAGWIISANLIISSKLSSTRTICETPFQANLQMYFPMVYNLIDNVVFAVAVFVATKMGRPSLLDISILYTICNLPGALLLGGRFARTFSVSFEQATKILRYLVIEAAPVALYLFFSILNTKVDILLLSRLATDADVCIYSAATRLVYPLVFFSTSFTLSIFPLLSKYYKTEPSRFLRIFNVGLKVIFILSIFITIPLAMNADKLIQTFYIESYAAAAGAFRLLSLSLGLNFFNFYFVDFMIAQEKQKLNTIILAIALLANVALNFFFIPKYSFIGASYVRLATALIIFVIFLIFIFKDVEKNIHWMKLIAVLLIFAGAQFFIKTWSIFAIAPIELFVFVSLLLIFKIITKEEGALVKGLFQKKSQ